jgi:hypothetical protein
LSERPLSDPQAAVEGAPDERPFLADSCRFSPYSSDGLWEKSVTSAEHNLIVAAHNHASKLFVLDQYLIAAVSMAIVKIGTQICRNLQHKLL